MTSLLDLLTQQTPNNLAPADNWQKRAACRNEDPELFFPIGATGPALAQAEQAKAVCRRCPVMETCLQWVMQQGHQDGIWGGTSEQERQNLRRARSRAKAKAAGTASR